MTTTTETRKALYDVGEAPPLGHVPPQMHAQVIRQSRFGQPHQAFQAEVIDTPEVGPDDALVYVMAAGVNYNNVWAGLGVPLDVIASRNKAGDPDNFHIGGSDASGIVYKVGANVTNVTVGDEVVIHCGTWDVACTGSARRAGPDVQPLVQDLGLRDQLRLLRPVHARAGAPVHAAREAPQLGSIGGAHARRFDRLSHALRLAAAHGARGRPGAHLGRRRRPRLHGHPARGAGGRPGNRRRFERSQVRLLHEARRRRLHQPQEVRPLEPPPELGKRRRDEQLHGERARVRQSHLGRPRRAQEPAHRV